MRVMSASTNFQLLENLLPWSPCFVFKSNTSTCKMIYIEYTILSLQAEAAQPALVVGEKVA